MQFIDEQDDLALLLGEVVEDRLQALLEFASELGPGDQRTHIEREQSSPLKALGHFPVDDALGQTLDDGGLADAGFTDQHRVVLGAPLQYLDGAADLVVTPDHRVELPLLGPFGHVDGVFFQRLALVFGIRIIHLLASPQLVDGLFDEAPAGTGLTQQVTHAALVLERRQNEQLAGDITVLALLGKLVGDIQQPAQLIGDMHLSGRALNLWQPVEQFTQA